MSFFLAEQPGDETKKLTKKVAPHRLKLKAVDNMATTLLKILFKQHKKLLHLIKFLAVMGI